MMNVLLGVSSQYRSGLSRRARIRLGFCQWWCPLFGTLMLASVVLPIVAIATRTQFVRVSLGGFYLHFGPPTLVMLLTVLWLRELKWLRPRAAKAFSWEIALFQVVRWPCALFGYAQAVAGRIARRDFNFKVTPKGRTGPAPLPLRVVAPYLLLALASATPALLGLNAGPANGYYTLALINIALYMTAAVSILALHIHEHPRDLRGAVLRSAAGPLAIGVTTAPLAANSTTPWSAKDLQTVTAFERAVHAHADIIMWYADWQHARFDPARLRAVARRGSIPEICWEPWNYAVGLLRPQPRFTLASIIKGRHDAYIRTWARELRVYRGRCCCASPRR